VEQVDHHRLAGHDDRRLAEVDLRLRTGRVTAHDHHLRDTRLDLHAQLAHRLAHRGSGDPGLLLLAQAFPDAPGRVALLARRGLVLLQPLADGPDPGTHHRGLSLRHRPGRWPCRRERLAHRPAMHVMAISEGAQRQPFLPMIDTDTLELLHPRQPLLPASEPSTVPSMGAGGSGVGPDQSITGAPGGVGPRRGASLAAGPFPRPDCRRRPCVGTVPPMMATQIGDGDALAPAR